MSKISIAQLFEDKKEKLKLNWIAGQRGGDTELSDEAIAQSGQGLIGHLNFIHPDWIQVISSDEIHYLNKLDYYLKIPIRLRAVRFLIVCLRGKSLVQQV